MPISKLSGTPRELPFRKKRMSFVRWHGWLTKSGEKDRVRQVSMPLVTLRNVVDGREETLTEYICDWPGCPHPGIHLIGVLAELRLRTVVCAKHAAQIAGRADSEPHR